jgi:uncharacterized protein
MQRLELDTSADGDVVMRVRVTPRARSTSLNGVVEGTLQVKLNAPPVDGAANKALCVFLARTLKVSRGSVSIVRGERSREKTLSLRGISADDVRETLER